MNPTIPNCQCLNRYSAVKQFMFSRRSRFEAALILWRARGSHCFSSATVASTAALICSGSLVVGTCLPGIHSVTRAESLSRITIGRV
eukprot:3105072-Amphidinium_carterae.1